MYNMKSVVDILSEIRIKKGISQKKIAERIGKSQKTIQNWENGIGRPDIDELCRWIRAVDENEMSIFLLYKYGAHALDPVDDVREKKRRIHEYVDQLMTDSEIDILYYLFSGLSGSSVYSYFQKIAADLSTPLEARIATAALIRSNYEMSDAIGLTPDDGPNVDIEMMTSAITAAADAVTKGNKVYKGL